MAASGGILLVRGLGTQHVERECLRASLLRQSCCLAFVAACQLRSHLLRVLLAAVENQSISGNRNHHWACSGGDLLVSDIVHALLSSWFLAVQYQEREKLDGRNFVCSVPGQAYGHSIRGCRAQHKIFERNGVQFDRLLLLAGASCHTDHVSIGCGGLRRFDSWALCCLSRAATDHGLLGHCPGCACDRSGRMRMLLRFCTTSFSYHPDATNRSSKCGVEFCFGTEQLRCYLSYLFCLKLFAEKARCRVPQAASTGLLL